MDTIESKIFIYKLTCDNGGAPCVEDGLISLCICKPKIRTTAEKGNWIIGVGGKSVAELKDRLIYVMRVEKVISGKDYYSSGSEYWNRPDCIYEWTGKKYKFRNNAQYHSAEKLETDLGEPEEYNRAFCLVSNCFAYFGDSNKKTQIEKIGDIYEKLTRSHQNKAENYQKLKKYIECILKEYGCGRHGNPIHLEKSKKCNEAEDNAVMQCQPE